jgi:enterochelin esterase-like enzyme
VSSSVIVDLTSSDESEALVPQQVEIPAGLESVTFSIAAVDDLQTDGQQTVKITATAERYGSGQVSVRVNDDERPPPGSANIPGATFSKPRRDADGFVAYSVSSNFQRSSNTIRVLLPSNYDPTKSYRVVYVLPVEKGNGRQFGDGLITARNLRLQNTYDAIFVAPTFSDNPWYADHVSNSQIWQETYFRKVVVPFVEDQYGIDARPENRLLLGFSKSGYGAVSMLLRFPETFGRAVTWDSPLTMSDPKAGFGFLDVLGSRQNFTQNYQVTSLIANRGSALTGSTPRIILMGYSNSYPYYRDHASIDAQLTKLRIPHIHVTGVLRSHVWHSGWMVDAVKYLLT